mgnify:CR=1 FL=1
MPIFDCGFVWQNARLPRPKVRSVPLAKACDKILKFVLHTLRLFHFLQRWPTFFEPVRDLLINYLAATR